MKIQIFFWLQDKWSRVITRGVCKEKYSDLQLQEQEGSEEKGISQISLASLTKVEESKYVSGQTQHRSSWFGITLGEEALSMNEILIYPGESQGFEEVQDKMMRVGFLTGWGHSHALVAIAVNICVCLISFSHLLLLIEPASFSTGLHL